jgi:hypothetical protein
VKDYKSSSLLIWQATALVVLKKGKAMQLTKADIEKMRSVLKRGEAICDDLKQISESLSEELGTKIRTLAIELDIEILSYLSNSTIYGRKK